MANIDFNSLFTRIGANGHLGYVLAGDQSALPAVLSTLIALYTGTSDADLIGSTITNKDSIINPVSGPPSSISGVAVSTLVRMVNTSVPSITAAGPAMAELIRQMIANGESVTACTVTCSNAALSTNMGSGVVVTSTKRGDGLVQENMFAEILRLSCTSDSYTGSATVGAEQFQLAGQPNTAPLWNYNYPLGSAASASLNAINAAQNASNTGNILTNSDFEDWSDGTSTGTLNNWVLVAPAVYGTDIQQSATFYDGAKALQFLPDTGVNTTIYQEFNNSTTGTAINPTPFNSYPVNFWMRSLAGVPGAGVLTVELVDGSGTVINDGAGTANSFTQSMTALTTSWVPVNGVFRIPEIPPAIMRVRLRMSTALTTQSVLVDRMAMAPFTAAYPGGFGFSVFSGDTPFTTGDGFSITTTNDRGGASYLGTFQALFDRLFSMRINGFLLPSSGSPTQADTKITT